MDPKALRKWLSFHPYGEQLVGTPFVAFKVPIHNELIVQKIAPPSRFSFQDLLTKHHKIGLVIDLTFTDKYYHSSILHHLGISYIKIYCNGHGKLPSRTEINKFTNAVDQFISTQPDKLIGVHCTHGLNRTGYLICRYMIERMRFRADQAIHTFQQARGHVMERKNYVDDLYDVEQRAVAQSRYQSRVGEEMNQRSRRTSNGLYGQTRGPSNPADWRSIYQANSRSINQANSRSRNQANWRSSNDANRRSHPGHSSRFYEDDDYSSNFSPDPYGGTSHLKNYQSSLPHHFQRGPTNNTIRKFY